MARYRVTARVPSAAPDGLTMTRVVAARCAQAAACEVATPYVDAGLCVDWSSRRTGLRGLGRRWSGRFVPGDGDDGLAGVREPRRPHPPAGTATAELDLG